MTVITFDTLAFSKTLQESGMSKEQADAFAKAQKQAISEMVETKELATKTDLLKLEASISEKMLHLENKLSEKIETNKHEMLKWVIGTTLAQTAIILAIIAFMK